MLPLWAGLQADIFFEKAVFYILYFYGSIKQKLSYEHISFPLIS